MIRLETEPRLAHFLVRDTDGQRKLVSFDSLRAFAAPREYNANHYKFVLAVEKMRAMPLWQRKQWRKD